MKQPEEHNVHTSLIKEPTIAGVSRGLFGIEFALSVLFLNFFRFSIISLVLIVLFCFVIHPALRSLHKEDPLLLQLLIISLFKIRSYYPGQPSINRDEGKPRSSIPDLK